ncbi:hypothetical protein [Pseudomonas sp. RA_35y_Pfl2_P32]|uniref:hypothetical protein n=1 Tax=Pseudomonas sp. RA_35y_Pfl2_P32 TaxID=3088705 RepID=UPI0030DDB64E
MLGLWVVAAMGSVMLTPASADHWRGGREGGEWKDEYREEIKCPNGRGASWRRGEWNDEFREHGCKVKIEAKRDEYKKEIKCDGDD